MFFSGFIFSVELVSIELLLSTTNFFQAATKGAPGEVRVYTFSSHGCGDSIGQIDIIPGKCTDFGGQMVMGSCKSGQAEVRLFGSPDCSGVSEEFFAPPEKICGNIALPEIKSFAYECL